MVVRDPRGIIDDPAPNWQKRMPVRPPIGPPRKKQKNALLGTFCSVLICVCGPASIPGAVAGHAAPMPNPWGAYAVQPTADQAMEYPPTHAVGPNLQAGPYAPNQTPMPEDVWNPVVTVPDCPEWRTLMEGWQAVLLAG